MPVTHWSRDWQRMDAYEIHPWTRWVAACGVVERDDRMSVNPTCAECQMLESVYNTAFEAALAAETEPRV
jgi:hypothetical protein